MIMTSSRKKNTAFELVLGEPFNNNSLLKPKPLASAALFQMMMVGYCRIRALCLDSFRPLHCQLNRSAPFRRTSCFYKRSIKLQSKVIPVKAT